MTSSRAVLNLACLALGVATAGALVGCGGQSDHPAGALPSSDGGVSIDSAAPPAGDDDGSVSPPVQDATAPIDSSPPPTGQDAATNTGDAAARNAACVPESQQTGTIVNTSHGRLDGTLVYVLPVDGSSKCNGDSSHVHLQVEVSGLVYDIAVDIGTSPNDEVGVYQKTMALPDDPWSEGWHGTDALSYRGLGLSSTNFPIQTPALIASQVQALLENTTQISIFCTGYPQGNGCHDVHYENGSSTDGAIVLDPTAATSPVLFFRFQSDSF